MDFFFEFVSFCPFFIEISILLFLILQILYFTFLTSNLFFGHVYYTKSNFFVAIYISILLLNIFFFIDPFYQSFLADFNIDTYAIIIKGMVLLFCFIVIMVSNRYLIKHNICQYELSVLILFSILALCLLSCGNDALSIFVAFEFQGLSFYILSTFYWSSNYSVETGLKYFILGSFTSCLFLLGFSIVYCLIGSMSFEFIFLLSSEQYSVSLIFLSIVFCLTALLFKVGASPFHFWLPDIYEGSILPVTFFFAIVPKFVIFYLLLKILILFVAFEYNFSSLLCLFSGFISVLVGAIASIFQKKIKRLFAYSTISHTGFILLGTFGLSSLGFKSIFFYLLIYILMNISIFSILLGNKHAILKYIINWSYFFSRNIALSIVFSFILLSMAGIPPLAGFFSKLLIIISVIQQGYVIFSFFLVIFTCIGCYYYIRLLKIFYFGTNISGVWINLESRFLEISIVIFTTIVIILFLFTDIIVLFSIFFGFI